MAEIIRDITIGGSITQQSASATAAKKYSARLQSGYVYEVVDAWIYADCSSMIAGTASDLTAWYLADASGNTICSINTASATATNVLQAGTTMGTPSSTYKRIDCSTAAGRIYLTHQSSGAGIAASGIRCVVRLNVYRPGPASPS